MMNEQKKFGGVEMSNGRKVAYNETISKDYIRTYANTTVNTLSGVGDVVIDFYEEVLDPLVIVERPVDDDLFDEEAIWSHDSDLIKVERNKKVSVTLNQAQALRLARWILESCHEEGE